MGRPRKRQHEMNPCTTDCPTQHGTTNEHSTLFDREPHSNTINTVRTRKLEKIARFSSSLRTRAPPTPSVPLTGRSCTPCRG
eukprot:345167-Chlamydomonas_euryale.AAC.1